MSKKVIITDMPVEYDGKQYFHTVSAVFEDNKCIMLNINNNNSITGNIYLGRVLNIVNNINSAFVSIDKDNTCYYSLTDNRRHYFFNPKNNISVNQGDSILVQVKKDAVKTKPASLSSDIVISGYYVVLSTDVEGVLVSKKIHDSEQIIQLRHKLLDLLKEKYDDNPDIPDKHTIYSMSVNNHTTFGNSIYPGNYIDIYLKAVNKIDEDDPNALTKDADKIMYAKLISNIEILAVKDSSGQPVFQNIDEGRTPSMIIFAVPEEYYILLKKAGYMRTYDTSIDLVPTNESLKDEPDSLEISSEQLKDWINTNTAWIEN